jgi:F-type H+-transporting ATPase subunit gamma
MRASRPYLERVFDIAMDIARANTEYRHPFLVRRETVKRVGAIVAIKVLLDRYLEGAVDEVWVFYTTFVNTMKQEPRGGRVVPVPRQFQTPGGQLRKAETQTGQWDYIYEPSPQELLDGMMRRYIEAVVYQMVAENMASEQSARMVAMKAASDNAGKIINELQLIYNKTRQAAITKEISEIVGGAAAV